MHVVRHFHVPRPLLEEEGLLVQTGVAERDGGLGRNPEEQPQVVGGELAVVGPRLELHDAAGRSARRPQRAAHERARAQVANAFAFGELLRQVVAEHGFHAFEAAADDAGTVADVGLFPVRRPDGAQLQRSAVAPGQEHETALRMREHPEQMFHHALQDGVRIERTEQGRTDLQKLAEPVRRLRVQAGAAVRVPEGGLQGKLALEIRQEDEAQATDADAVLVVEFAASGIGELLVINGEPVAALLAVAVAVLDVPVAVRTDEERVFPAHAGVVPREVLADVVDLGVAARIAPDGETVVDHEPLRPRAGPIEELEDGHVASPGRYN